MEDDLNMFENGRRPQFFGKWKTTSLFQKLKTTSIFWEMEDRLKKTIKKIMLPETLKIKAMVVAPLRVTLLYSFVLVVKQAIRNGVFRSV